MRWGLKEAQSKSAGRGTRTGSEVWYTRDERARDREVLHLPTGGVLYKFGVYARNVLGLTPGDLSRALGFRVRKKLAEGEAIPSDREKEVCKGHSRRGTVEGPNGTPRGSKREEQSIAKELRYCIRRARASMG